MFVSDFSKFCVPSSFKVLEIVVLVLYKHFSKYLQMCLNHITQVLAPMSATHTL